MLLFLLEVPDSSLTIPYVGKMNTSKYRDDGTLEDTYDGTNEDMLEDDKSYSSGSSRSHSEGSFTFGSDTMESMALSNKVRHPYSFLQISMCNGLLFNTNIPSASKGTAEME